MKKQQQQKQDRQGSFL